MTTIDRIIQTYHPDGFVTPPGNQGQIVDVSYGLDNDAEVIVVRTYDASDRTTIYTAYRYPTDDDGSWAPWNGAPELGDEIGPCFVD